MAITLGSTRSAGGPRSSFGLVVGSGIPAPEKATSMPQVFRMLREFGVRQAFARNETIFSEGGVTQNVYMVMSGTVRLCRHTSDGRRHIAEFVLAGDVFGIGETASHSFTAEAVNEVTLTSCPKAEFNRLVASNAQVRSLLMAHLEGDLAIAQHHHFVLGCQNARERLISFLLRLAVRTDVASGERVELPMGRQDIADHLGLTIETVCRSLAALKGEAMVTVPNTHQVILNDIPALRSLAIAA